MLQSLPWNQPVVCFNIIHIMINLNENNNCMFKTGTFQKGFELVKYSLGSHVKTSLSYQNMQCNCRSKLHVFYPYKHELEILVWCLIVFYIGHQL